MDWSDVREQLRMMTLRASISVKGRSITLYERTFLFEANRLEIAMPRAVITLSSLSLQTYCRQDAARSSSPMQVIAILGLGKSSAMAGFG